jgi:integrase
VTEDEGSGQTILEIEVRGKRGVGYCKSTTGAVHPFERLKARLRPDGGPGRAGSRTASMANGEWHAPGPTDLLFPKWPRELFNAILEEEKLRTDRDGRPRTAYSLRHTYICLRLLEGADIYQIAKNCRTSVEMIEKYYAAAFEDAARCFRHQHHETTVEEKDGSEEGPRTSRGRTFG